jgi:hypothetical protein
MSIANFNSKTTYDLIAQNIDCETLTADNFNVSNFTATTINTTTLNSTTINNSGNISTDTLISNSIQGNSAEFNDITINNTALLSDVFTNNLTVNGNFLCSTVRSLYGSITATLTFCTTPTVNCTYQYLIIGNVGIFSFRTDSNVQLSNILVPAQIQITIPLPISTTFFNARNAVGYILRGNTTILLSAQPSTKNIACLFQDNQDTIITGICTIGEVILN